ncbi:MAG TPA: hypothetical protein ACFYED_11710 [Candidatus Tripitaka californicus]|uniref:hypothetical protein n=1 Tax=Candidatus Tripitaka californicus TaxID=3367616 RepID=UPI004025DED1|nr:hypothetical protein [Planctomycetota bacterium]
MTSERIFWGLGIIFIAGLLLFLYAPRPEKVKSIDTSAEISISDSLIAGTAKLIIRQAINRTDIEKTKKRFAEKLKKSSDSRYKKEINKIFGDVEYMGLTDTFTNTFRITRNSSREEVIKAIENIDKDILLTKLDEVPEQAIAKLIRKKLQEKRLNSIVQLKDYLGKCTQKVIF